jgi:hypothetical protein
MPKTIFFSQATDLFFIFIFIAFSTWAKFTIIIRSTPLPKKEMALQGYQGDLGSDVVMTS